MQCFLFFKVINTMFEDAKRLGRRVFAAFRAFESITRVFFQLNDFKPFQADNCHSSFQAVWEHHAKLEGAGAHEIFEISRLF